MSEIIILLLINLFDSSINSVLFKTENSDEYDTTDREMIISSNFIDVDDLINGDIPLFTDFHLPSLEDRRNKTMRRRSDDQMMTTNELPVLIAAHYDQISSQNSSYDIVEFNDLNTVVNNITRRYRGWYHGMSDPDDRPKNIEKAKHDRMVNIVHQFLLHARYLVRVVLGSKEHFRNNVKYKLGYLFNRMRRIRYEQLKIVTEIENQLNESQLRNLTSLLRFYEKVVRMDIDVKDTIKWIKSLHEADLEKNSSARKEKDNKNT